MRRWSFCAVAARQHRYVTKTTEADGFLDRSASHFYKRSEPAVIRAAAQDKGIPANSQAQIMTGMIIALKCFFGRNFTYQNCVQPSSLSNLMTEKNAGRGNTSLIKECFQSVSWALQYKNLIPNMIDIISCKEVN